MVFFKNSNEKNLFIRKVKYFLTNDNKYKSNRDLSDLSSCYCLIARNKGY